MRRGPDGYYYRPDPILKTIAERRVVSRLQKAMRREPLRVKLLRLVCKHCQYVPLRGLGSKFRPSVARMLSHEPDLARPWGSKVVPSWYEGCEFDDHATNLVYRSCSQTWGPSERDTWLQNREEFFLHWEKSSAANMGMTSSKYLARQGSWLHSWECTLSADLPTGLHSFVNNCGMLRHSGPMRSYI